MTMTVITVAGAVAVDMMIDMTIEEEGEDMMIMKEMTEGMGQALEGTIAMRKEVAETIGTSFDVYSSFFFDIYFLPSDKFFSFLEW